MHLSIEITQRCSKACAFCYASSTPLGDPGWSADEVLSFCRSVAEVGLGSVSLGGGEPLEHPEWAKIVADLAPIAPRTLTTSGLPLTRSVVWDTMLKVRPDKVHLSIHEPDRHGEVERVVEQVVALESAGIASGVNLVVRRSTLRSCRAVVERLATAGVGLDRIVLLPLRGSGAAAADTPSATEVAQMAGNPRFRSTSCLTGCEKSPPFVSIGWDKTAAWCSYTVARRRMPSLDAAGLARALSDLPLSPCINLARHAQPQEAAP